MAFKDGHSPSLGSKLTLSLLSLAGVIYAMRYLEFGLEAGTLHTWLLIACVLLFYIRLIISLFAFIRRKVSWFEGITVGTLYGIMLAGFTVWGKEVSPTKDSWDIAGFLLFCFGSYINSLSDYQRHIWKKRPENSGRLYTEGLFRYSMHINYFGDSVMLVGFAIVTQNPLSFIPVLLIILNLLFLQIPRLDDHLKNKYGAEFLEYEIKTRKFIPFIY